MIPLRSQIRDVVIERLKSCAVLRGNVFDTPRQSFEPSQLPLLMLTVDKDQALSDWTSILMTTLACNTLIQLRELTLHLKIVANATSAVAHPLDAIASDVTRCLLADRTLGGLCKTLQFPDVTDMTVTEEGEIPLCSVTLHCQIWYRLVEGMPYWPVA